ncbi:MAG: hypothetical protein IT289_13205 [Oligoflexia bacterium]|nr:hypothetical protein [Oligoflexia bacterium]
MKKMMIPALTVLALSLGFVGQYAHAECACSKKCATECKEHKGKGCKCKSCECGKTGECKHSEEKTDKK